MRLKDIKAKTPPELLSFAESLQVENSATLKRQDLMFAILKKLSENEV
ncbi:MAG: Rho termination factor N-terminal domain-containing protein, partial [Holosporaceae bacterium]|nr:Rho termination factor N-terminal domain-containing protein [Holosporaceae bacterium]